MANIKELLKKSLGKELNTTRHQPVIADDYRPDKFQGNDEFPDLISTHYDINRHRKFSTETNTKTNTISNTNSLSKSFPKKRTLKDTRLKPLTDTESNTINDLSTIGFSYSHLVQSLEGNQQKIFWFIFKECQRAETKITCPLPTKFIGQFLKIEEGSVKNSLVRLCKKGYLDLVEYRRGRGGYSRYKIPDAIYQEFLRIQNRHKKVPNI